MMNARKTCGKRRFETEYAAGKRLRRNQERAARNNYRYPVRYYECSACDGFHLTSKPDRNLPQHDGIWVNHGEIWIIPRLDAEPAAA